MRQNTRAGRSTQRLRDARWWTGSGSAAPACAPHGNRSSPKAWWCAAGEACSPSPTFRARSRGRFTRSAPPWLPESATMCCDCSEEIAVQRAVFVAIQNAAIGFVASGFEPPLMEKANQHFRVLTSPALAQRNASNQTLAHFPARCAVQSHLWRTKSWLRLLVVFDPWWIASVSSPSVVGSSAMVDALSGGVVRDGQGWSEVLRQREVEQKDYDHRLDVDRHRGQQERLHGEWLFKHDDSLWYRRQQFVEIPLRR